MKSPWNLMQGKDTFAWFNRQISFLLLLSSSLSHTYKRWSIKDLHISKSSNYLHTWAPLCLPTPTKCPANGLPVSKSGHCVMFSSYLIFQVQLSTPSNLEPPAVLVFLCRIILIFLALCWLLIPHFLLLTCTKLKKYTVPQGCTRSVYILPINFSISIVMTLEYISSAQISHLVLKPSLIV